METRCASRVGLLGMSHEAGKIGFIPKIFTSAPVASFLSVVPCLMRITFLSSVLQRGHFLDCSLFIAERIIHSPVWERMEGQVRAEDDTTPFATPTRSRIAPGGGGSSFSLDRGNGDYGFSMGAADRIGGRSQLEDEYTVRNDLPGAWSVCAVYDGHGGRSVARYLRDNAVESVAKFLNEGDNEATLQKAIHLGLDGLDRAILDEINSKRISKHVGEGHRANRSNLEGTKGAMELESDAGSTACFVFLNRPLGMVVVANVGDCRAVFCRNGTAEILTTDQKPSRPEEKERIKVAGGWVAGGRVCGILGVSRSFGDIEFKRWHNMGNPESGSDSATCSLDQSSYLVVATPEVQTVAMYPGGEFVIVACDGVWDVLSPQVAVDSVTSSLKSSPGDPGSAADALVSRALEMGSSDNCTAVICILDLH